MEGFTAKKKSKILYSLNSPIVPAKTRVRSNIENNSTSSNETFRGIEVTDTHQMIDSDEEPMVSFEEGSGEEYKLRDKMDKPLIKFNQKSLSDFIRNMGLPKDDSEFMAAELKRRGMVERGTKSTLYRDREKTFCNFFSQDEQGSFIYCDDICGLMNTMKQDCYAPDEWSLFIDSSKRSLKAVLLHNGN